MLREKTCMWLSIEIIQCVIIYVRHYVSDIYSLNDRHTPFNQEPLLQLLKPPGSLLLSVRGYFITMIVDSHLPPGASDPELSNSPKKMKERILKSAAKNKITVSKDETKLVLNRILQSPVHAEINLRGGDISPGDYSEKLDNEKDYKKFIEWLAPRSQELQEIFS